MNFLQTESLSTSQMFDCDSYHVVIIFYLMAYTCSFEGALFIYFF